MIQPKVYSFADVAKLLVCSEKSIRRRVLAGDMPAPARFGNKPCWPRTLIDRWIEDRLPRPRSSDR